MDIELKAPSFPESVVDGSIVNWYKQPGDHVKKNEVLVDVETDKVMFDVPSHVDGVLKEIVAPVGETVVSQQVLAIIHENEVGDDKGNTSAQESANKVVSMDTTEIKNLGSVGIAPAARKLIAEHGLDSSQIKGTGRGGRILKEDVITSFKEAEESFIDEGVESEQEISVNPVLDPPEVDFTASEKRVPMTRLRARIAERLVEAQQTAAILTTFNEVNMQPVMEMRQKYRDIFEKTHEVRLGFMSFFVKASVEALKRFPAVNASIDGKDIVYHNYFDIGIAVSSPRGLVVPVLRNAESLNMAGIESGINEYALKAKQSTLAIEEISGGTFTITNGGVFGSLLSTPILNPPQSAILGMHKIEQRAVVVDGNIVARPMMYLALSYDHRIIDGQEAVQFLVVIKEMLEDPARMLLEV